MRIGTSALIRGVNHFMVQLDVLHTNDHGVSPHVFAGCLYTLVYEQLPGTPKDNMARIWSDIQEFYDALGTRERLQTLSMKMWHDPEKPHSDYPKLSNTLKAAETRALAPVMFQLFVRYDDKSDVARFRRITGRAPPHAPSHMEGRPRDP